MMAQKASPSWNEVIITIIIVIFVNTFILNVVTITIMLTLQQVDMSVMVTVG